MALTLEDLKRLMNEVQLAFFLHPDIPILLFMITGKSGRYEFCLHLDPEGKTLQIRTFNFLSCHPNHIHAGPVLAALGEFNNNVRFVKLGWDRNNGAITAYHDVLILDGTMSSDQFKGALHAFMSGVDQIYGMLRHVIDTGLMPNAETQ